MRQEAIELIVALKGHTLPKGVENAYNRLCKAITEAEKQEPVAWMWKDGSIKFGAVDLVRTGLGRPSTSPPQPQREWVGLTDDEIDGLVKNTRWHELIKATEAKLKEKNQ
jgi:hypothetical protein